MTALYRYWDGRGRLLYVGIADHFPSRAAQHDRNEGWVGRTERVTVEHFPSRDEAKQAEAYAIEHERPRYNRQGSPRYRRVMAYLARRKERVRPTTPQRHVAPLVQRRASMILNGVERAQAIAYRDGMRVVRLDDLEPNVRLALVALLGAEAAAVRLRMGQ